MSTLHDVPLGQPRIYWDELDETSPGFFKALAAPSDHMLVVMWAVLAFVNLINSTIIATVFASVAVNKRCRRKPFNVFLLFLMFPDFLFSFMCFVTCWLSAMKGEYWSSAMCKWQSIYIIFGNGSNAWLNLLTTGQMHRLLQSSKGKTRYRSPKVTTVVMQSLGVYAYSLLLACAILFEGKGLPHDVDVQYGFVCLPMQYDNRGVLFWYACFFPLFVGIPIAYVVYVAFDVWFRELLPPSGKSRHLAIYFFRLNFLFIALWSPPILVYYALRGIHPWGMYVLGALGHLYGGVAALLSARKPDIARAISEFIPFGSCTGGKQSSSEERSAESFTGFGIASSKSQSSTSELMELGSTHSAPDGDGDGDNHQGNELKLYDPTRSQQQDDSELSSSS